MHPPHDTQITKDDLAEVTLTPQEVELLKYAKLTERIPVLFWNRLHFLAREKMSKPQAYTAGFLLARGIFETKKETEHGKEEEIKTEA